MKWRQFLTGALIVGILPAILLLTAGTAGASPAPDPRNDPFYRQPTSFAGHTPGQILKSRPVEVGLAGVPLPFAAYQIQYVSTDTSGVRQAAVATLLKPLTASGSPKLVSYQPAIDSLSSRCDPSYQLRSGTSLEVPQIAVLLNQGWTVVVPDFLGPDHQWGVGHVEGQSTLDGIRAAENFAPAKLEGRKTPVALTGYSGGARGTEIAYELAPAYAPELNIVGAAAGGLGVDMEKISRNANGGLFSGVVFAGLFGLDRAYPSMKMDSILTDKGKELRRTLSDMCVFEYTAAYAFKRVQSYTVGGIDPLTVPAVRTALAENKPGAFGTPKAPGYFYNASADELVIPADVDKLAARYCAKGVVVQSVTQPGDHVSMLATGYPGAVSWIADRFADKPAPSTC